MLVRKFNFCIQRIKTGDTKWLADIYNEYYGTMVSTAWSKVKNMEAAEYIALDFIKYILFNADKIGHIDFPEDWISLVIYKKAVNYLQKNRKEVHAEDLCKDSLDRTIDYDFYRTLKNSFNNLTNYEQNLAVLRFVGGFKLSEIALSQAVPIIKVIGDTCKIQRRLQRSRG